VGPEIHELMFDDEFKTQLKPVELAVWEAIVLVVQNYPVTWESQVRELR